MPSASGPWMSSDSTTIRKLLPIDLWNTGSVERPDVVLEADEALGVGEVVPLDRLRQVEEAVDAGEHDRQDHEAEEDDERRPDEEHDLEPTCGPCPCAIAGASGRGPGPRKPRARPTR